MLKSVSRSFAGGDISKGTISNKAQIGVEEKLRGGNSVPPATIARWHGKEEDGSKKGSFSSSGKKQQTTAKRPL